jgi:protein-disulfide isomerase
MSFSNRVKSALDVGSTIAVIVAAGVLLWTLLIKQPAAAARPLQVEQVTGLQIDAAQITNVSGTGRIAIVEFSDFQCPFCRSYAKETLPTITRDLVDSGDVRYVAMHYPIEEIHPLAAGASEAAECAGRQGRFWEMHQRLFDNADALTPMQLGEHAQMLGLDQAQFDKCLTGHETLDKVHSDRAEGRRLGVRGTPAFFIGTVRPDGGIDLVTRIRGAANADVFAQQIAELDSRSPRHTRQ